MDNPEMQRFLQVRTCFSCWRSAVGMRALLLTWKARVLLYLGMPLLISPGNSLDSDVAVGRGFVRF